MTGMTGKLLKITKDQREILFGILLGDAHAEYSPNGKSVRIKIEQSQRHSEYVNHLHEVFSSWNLSDVAQRRGNCLFSTPFSPSLLFYANQFYTFQDPQGKKDKKDMCVKSMCVKRKIVPKLLHRWLTPKGLAYWYMDDGSLKSSESKGVLLKTHGFSTEDVSRLCNLLETQFQLLCKPRAQKEGKQVYISGKSYETLRKLIWKHIIPEMRYKFPPPRKVRGQQVQYQERLTQLPKR